MMYMRIISSEKLATHSGYSFDAKFVRQKLAMQLLVISMTMPMMHMQITPIRS